MGPSADEFAHVRSPRRRNPVIALAAAGLAFFLLAQIREDIFFALSSSTPRDLGDARTVAATPVDKLPLNRLVRVSGMADRESGVTIDTAGSWKFTQFFRVLGTGSRLFVSRVPDPIPVEQAERDVYVGRLLPFRDLSFAEAIRKHFANRVTATHFFVPAALRDGVTRAGGGPLVMTDMLGEKVSLASNDELSFEVARPSDIQVDFPVAKVADIAAARALVERNGGTVLDEVVKAHSKASISVAVTFPADKRDQGMNALAELDEKVRFNPMRRTVTVRIADLAATADGFVLKTGGQSQTLALGQILAIRTLANVQIPRDALLLREGERPAEHLRSVVVGGFLLAFALINLLALRRRG